MNLELVKKKKKKGFVTSSTLILFSFATAFFPRVLETIGFPAPINFVHFITVPLTCLIVLKTTRIKDRKQIALCWKIIYGLFLLLTVILASAVINNAGTINAFLTFILLGEPFIFILFIVANSTSIPRFEWLHTWFIRCFFLHLFLVFVQRYVLKVNLWHHLPMTGEDRIQGVFFLSGAGHVVGASVSLSFAVYFFAAVKNAPLWLRLSVIAAAFWNIVVADAKQVLLVFMVASLLLILIKLDNIATVIKYLSIAIILGSLFFWAIQNIEALDGFNTWIRPEIYGPDGEATLLKTASLRIIPTYYKSILNWFFGLGPGHSVSRLGGWMLQNYANLLNPLGATTHPASKAVWRATGESWLGDQSSMFSPLFGWAGIWGDIGVFGLGAYLYLSSIVWRYICRDNVSKFLLLTVAVFGLIISQMEEPGYMLSVASIIGVQYQKNHLNRSYHEDLKISESE